MKIQFGFLSLVLAGMICLPAFAIDDKKDKETAKPEKAESAKPKKAEAKSDKPSNAKEEKFTATCPVSGAAAKKEQAVAYKDKEVYFCCEKCKAAFEADKAKFATKANLQLVQTKQFRQTACPLSGGKTNKEQTSKVEGVKVAFCCEKCKGAIDTASKEDQLAKVFADDVFAKSFTAKKADGESKKGKKDAAEKDEKKPEADKA